MDRRRQWHLTPVSVTQAKFEDPSKRATEASVYSALGGSPFGNN